MLTLRAGGWEATLRPEVGASLASLTLDGTEVLRMMPESSTSPLDAACFPLVPYCNRIRDGHFTFGGREVTLPANFPPERHSIHGFSWQHPWRVESAAANKCVLVYEYNGAHPWPWFYRAEQRVRLGEKGCAVTLVLTNHGDTPMPAGIGLHPYFRRGRSARVRFTADHVLLSDPQLRAELAERGRDRVSRYYGWPVVARQAVELYRTAIARRHGARAAVSARTEVRP